MASDRLARTLSEAIGRAIHETLRTEDAEPSQRQRDGQEQQLQQSQRPARGQLANDTQPSRQTTLVTVANSGISRQVATTSNSRQSNLAGTLPSLFGGNGIQFSNAGGRKRKRSTASVSKPGKTYTKDVVCLLPSSNVTDIPIPRGANRAELSDKGLIGKVSINSIWTAEEVARELTSIFATAFNLQPGELLPFDYLGITKGTKKLTIPKTSRSFTWNAPEVVSLCSQGCLYIKAKIKPNIDEDSDEDPVVVEDDEQRKESDEQECLESVSDSDIINIHPLSEDSLTEGNSCYRSYLGLLASDTVEVSDDEDNEQLQTAIENSLLPQHVAPNPDETTETVLSKHVAIVMVGQPSDVQISKNLINVRRNHVFEDGITKIARAKFEPSHPLSVRFADELGFSEGAVDLGGPTREFLRLAVREALTTNAFSGTSTSKVIVLNQEAKRKNLYFHCGKLLAISLCNGGSVGHCLAPCMFDFIVHGESNCHPSIDDIQDHEIKVTLQKISQSEDEASFRIIVRSDSVINCFAQAGYHGVAKLELKKELLTELCHFFVIDKARSALEQFKEGLRTLDILNLVKEFHTLFRPYFCYTPKTLTAACVDAIFTPILSEDGCRIREREELVIMHWRDYLQEREDTSSVNGSEFVVTLPSILIFATGLDEVPPLGFRPKPSIHFWEDVRPRSNTCGNILFLPLHINNNDLDYDTFKNMMDDAILNSPTFGLA